MKKIETGKAISFGWEAIKKDFWYFIGISAIYIILPSLFSYNKNWGLEIIGTLISTLLIAGFVKIFLEYYKGNKPAFETLFTQTKYFWRILGAQVLVGLIVVGGLILLIVPGIYWALKYQFVINLIVDKDMGITEAMGRSGELTKDIKMPLLVFDLALGGVIILGGIALGVGVFVAVPIVTLAEIYVYKKLS